jgi:hypothetical protein
LRTLGDNSDETRGTRGKRASARVRNEVMRHVLEGRESSTEIHRQIFPPGKKFDDYVSTKTIQRLVAARRAANAAPSPPWSFLDAEPKDAARIFDVVGAVFDISDGREWLTQELAGWVLRVRTAALGASYRCVWFLAHAYLLTKADPEPDSRALDLTLAIAPWTGPDQARHWTTMLRRGDLLDDTDARVIEILEALASLEGWPPLMPVDGTEPAAPDDALAWYEPNPDAADGRQGAAPATAPPGRSRP